MEILPAMSQQNAIPTTSGRLERADGAIFFAEFDGLELEFGGFMN